MSVSTTSGSDPQVAWSVRSWCAAVDVSHAYLYELLASGKVASVKLGGKRLVTTAPRDFIASLSGEAA